MKFKYLMFSTTTITFLMLKSVHLDQWEALQLGPFFCPFDPDTLAPENFLAEQDAQARLTTSCLGPGFRPL